MGLYVSICPLSPPFGGVGCAEGERNSQRSDQAQVPPHHPPPLSRTLKGLVSLLGQGSWHSSVGAEAAEPISFFLQGREEGRRGGRVEKGGEGRGGRGGRVPSQSVGPSAAGGLLNPADSEGKVPADHWQKTHSIACWFLFVLLFTLLTPLHVTIAARPFSSLYFLPNPIPSSLYLM